jgi:wyosine [tRNA(Phe)-imidazoG37] synthetase (radical SAM superfamily)
VNAIVYGPVPSRRLGRSLGINNVLPKSCSYSCVYCQLGKTATMQVERQTFNNVPELAQTVRNKIEQVKRKGENIDYLAFVPDGESTLDADLGREIKLLKPLGIQIALITNASLIWRDDVRRDLQQADWVSLKIDSVSERTWRKVNRPHSSLKLEVILEGMRRFASDYKGEITTETMLIQGVNDSIEDITRTAEFLAKLKPAKAYLAIPIRPPAVKSIKGASAKIIAAAYDCFSNRLSNVEFLVDYEGTNFTSTGNVAADLLAITSVHPMRGDAVTQFLSKEGMSWELIEQLMRDGLITETTYRGEKYYARKLMG